ncbi:MAG TPA: hypothetical protein VFR87_07890 [Nocardioidaceae bacterium]|nr:hypothetical protein [Nocardioidaceae bacterium]
MNERYDDQGRPDDGATTGRPTPADEAEQAEVSRLLAEVSGPPDAETMPAEVAARLDDVLAGLVAERRAGPASAVPDDEVVGVTDLASRRRRRWPALLVAAAAVSVVGLGVGNVLGQGGGADMGAGTTAESAADGEAVTSERLHSAEGGAEEGADRAKDGAAPSDAAAAPEPVDGRVNALAALPRLRSDSLAVDVQRLDDFALGDATQRELGRACVRPDLDKGDEWLSVRLDGERAVLVLRAPEDGRRTAEVFTCDEGDTAAAETTIEAR